MPTTTIEGHPGLQRMDYPDQSIACYRVKLLRQGAMFQEYFPFKNYESEAAALAEAKRCWRDIRETFPRMSRRQYCEVKRRNSRSGVVGVSKITKMRKGHKYEFWRATFTDRRGNHKVRIFSVNKYGDAGAKKRALEARKEALALLEG
jgi:hypothetical protein